MFERIKLINTAYQIYWRYRLKIPVLEGNKNIYRIKEESCAQPNNKLLHQQSQHFRNGQWVDHLGKGLKDQPGQRVIENTSALKATSKMARCGGSRICKLPAAWRLVRGENL